jgi:hypothetical protein
MINQNGHHPVRTGLFDTEIPATTRKSPIKPSNHKTKTAIALSQRRLRHPAPGTCSAFLRSLLEPAIPATTRHLDVDPC